MILRHHFPGNVGSGVLFIIKKNTGENYEKQSSETVVNGLYGNDFICKYANDKSGGRNKRRKNESEEVTDDVIEITKDSVETVIYDEKNIKVTVKDLSHIGNSGDPFFQIEYMIENNSAKDISVWMLQSYVEDFSIPTYGGNTIKAGKKGVADLSIWEKDLKSYDIDDFEIWESTIQIYDTEEVLLERNMFIQRDAFSSDSGENTEQEADENTSEESQSDDKYDELSKKIEELEAKNKELEDKNKELEDKLNKAEEEKNQESTPTLETTEEPAAAPETNQKPVVEYKDATTIRIVQQALNDAGYNCGNPDGVAGGKTTEAVTKYQTDKGLTVNGQVTDELLQALNVVEKVQDAVQKEASKGEYGGDYSYDQLARNPDTYKNQKIKISGKVLQAEYDDDICYARIAMNNDYNTVVFVTYSGDLLNYRLLEDDKVTVYGISYGVYSYKAVSGATITIPWLNADMIEM